MLRRKISKQSKGVHTKAVKGSITETGSNSKDRKTKQKNTSSVANKAIKRTDKPTLDDNKHEKAKKNRKRHRQKKTNTENGRDKEEEDVHGVHDDSVCENYDVSQLYLNRT